MITHVIPLFHTGHESPESLRIDFFYIRGGGGIREVSLFFSPIVMIYESVPIQIRCRYEYSGGIGSIWLESRKNSPRLAK